MEANAAGQIVHEWNPDGAAFTGAVAGAQAVAADVTYSYDPAGRLTEVVDRSDEVDGTGCRLRTYRFDARGNRLADTTAAATTGALCPTSGGVGTSRSYDAADRPATAGDGTAYTYDALGRQTLIPAADAPRPESGDVHLSYYDDDTAKAITQAGVSLSYTLDVAGRRTVQTTRRTLEAAVTESVTNHYVDDSDDPGWVTTVTASTASTTVYADLTSGGLSLSITTSGESTVGELALASPRGDVSATVTLPTDGEAAEGLDRWTRYTEYGTPVITPPTSTAGAAANGYGWLGAKQRSTTETGILLMGARLYNPVTGLFTSLDPVYGGNDTPYTYPNDPINRIDTTGEWGWLRKVGRVLWKYKWDIALTAASFIPVTAVAAWAYRGYKLARGGIYVVRTVSKMKYVGQSSKIAGRLARHVRNGKITKWQAATARVYRVSGGKVRREVAEQRMINRLGGIYKNGKRNLANIRNPIGARRSYLMRSTPRNWRRL